MKEARAYKVMELAGENSIAHDDKLMLRAVKSEIGLTADYRNFVEIKKRGAGESVIVNYIRSGKTPGAVLSITAEQFDKLSAIEKMECRPQYLRGLDLSGGVSLEIKNNQVDLRLYNLFDNLGSRYRSALDTMLQLESKGILKYSPRKEGNERNRTEAIRQVVKRHMKPTEYEHDILVSGELGKLVYRDMEALEGVERFPGTVYISGFKKYPKQEASYKYYDVGLRSGGEAGKYFKIEVTLYKEFFKKNGLHVNDITTQTETQNKILERLVGIYGKIISKMKGDTLEALQSELGFYAKGRYPHREIATELLRPERTLTERVGELEKDMSRIKTKVSRIEKDMYGTTPRKD